MANKKNGYMLVQYRASKPYLFQGEELMAKGKRLHIRPKHMEIMSQLRSYYDSAMSTKGINLIKKNLQEGWFEIDTFDERMLFAVMPFSNREIKDILI